MVCGWTWTVRSRIPKESDGMIPVFIGIANCLCRIKIFWRPFIIQTILKKKGLPSYPKAYPPCFPHSAESILKRKATRCCWFRNGKILPNPPGDILTISKGWNNSADGRVVNLYSFRECVVRWIYEPEEAVLKSAPRMDWVERLFFYARQYDLAPSLGLWGLISF